MSLLAPSARLVGNRISRKEDPRLLTGRGRYVDDVVVPGMLHVAFARSDIARGRIVSIDAAAAREAAGVVAVLTADELNHLIVGHMGATPVLSMGSVGPYKVLADDEVRYVGDPVRAGGGGEPRARRGCTRVDRARARAASSRRRLHDGARELGACASGHRQQRRGRDADAARRRAARDPRVGASRGDRAVRAEPLPRGADGDPRDRGLVATARRLVRRVRLHPVTARRAHRHQPHHRRAGEPDPGADGRRRRRLRPEGLPRTRRADRVARQLPPGQAAQVDRRSAREPARRDDVARGALHGHGGGRQRGEHPRDRGRPSRRGRGLPDGRQRRRHGRGHLHRAVPHTETRVRVAVRVHQHLLACAVPRTMAVRDLLPRAGDRRSRSPARHRPARAAPTQRLVARRAPVHPSARHPHVRRVARRDARTSGVDARLRRVPRVAARAVRGRTPPGCRHRPVHRTAEHDRVRTAPSLRTSASSPTGPSTPTSARDRTGKGSRRRPRNS